MVILAHDGDGFVLCGALQLIEVVNELDQELCLHAAILRPAQHLVLSDAERRVVLKRGRERHTPHTCVQVQHLT